MSSSLQDAWARGYLSGGSMAYVDALYEDFLEDPNRVSADWQAMFKALPKTSSSPDVSHKQIRDYFQHLADHPTLHRVSGNEENTKQRQVSDLVHAYRSEGHLGAHLDPLNMTPPSQVANLSPITHQLQSADLNRQFAVDKTLSEGQIRLSDLQQRLDAIYCGHIGIEYMHCAHQAEISWLQEKFEGQRGKPNYDAATKRQLLEELIAADGLERYLATRYVGQKRFSLEGGDAFVPMLKEIIRLSGQLGVKEMVIGMAHRGRLNVLINVLGKSPAELFQEFEGKKKLEGTGDVKYHLGYSSDIPT
ncbi:MAG: 2-oxoglutarate dehydrogenase E1 component, partial [Legionella sp. 21-45-4]